MQTNLLFLIVAYFAINITYITVAENNHTPLQKGLEFLGVSVRPKRLKKYEA